MKILSLFDGMSCGNIAMINAGVKIDRYVAYEIDKYAIQATQHNFPYVEQMGDVFKADFTAYKGFDFLVGGSPCTYWSIAQTKNRETVASGIGWELFSQYVRALNEAQPKYFIYENNKSMSQAIKQSITETFGFEPICINSALVSAQNRQRLYWVGILDGNHYRKAQIEQPQDKGILLKDILDSAQPVLTSANRRTGKSRTLTAGYTICSQRDLRVNIESDGFCGKQGAAEPINITEDGKSGTIRATMYKDTLRNLVANDYDKRTCVAEPINTMLDDGEKSRTLMSGYYKYGTATMITNEGFKGGTTGIAEPIRLGGLYNQVTRWGIYDENGKSPTFCAAAGQGGGHVTMIAKDDDGKTKPIYIVKDGQITIKGKQYPIKLKDGYYIIRKLTVNECKRLQTVPDWYEFPISNSQAYKCLGNGWTCDVITHLILSALNNGVEQKYGQLTIEF